MSKPDCVICDKTLKDGSKTTVVKKKGLTYFAEESKQRNDSKINIFLKNSSLEIHEKCRVMYTKNRCISAYVKRAERALTKSQLRSSTPIFNFKTHCFLCGEEIPEDYAEKESRYEPCKRNPVHQVTKLGVKEKVLGVLNDKDEFSLSIRKRLESVNDLVAADGQYHSSCMKKLYRPNLATERGRPKEEVDGSMDGIYTFLENSDEECQFSLEELMSKIETDYKPHPKTVLKRLQEKYERDIIISLTAPYVICFRNTGYRILNESWYNQKCATEKEERLRIVKTAAAIIVEDIRSEIYDTAHYPPPENFVENDTNLIPESLQVFTNAIIFDKKRGDFEKLKKKSSAISHCLINAVRPKSFISPLQVGLAAFLYKKYGSRKLLDVLSSLGFCSSYKEAMRFEISSIMRPPVKIKEQGFSQMIYDNADFNVQTLDGRNTFHAMGGILCITPKSVVALSKPITRLKNIPSSEEVARVGEVKLKDFKWRQNCGLASIKIKDLNVMFPQNTIVPSVSHLVWLYCKHMGFPLTVGWNGFMEDVTKNVQYETTFIDTQPFINAPPTDYDTIYTALCTAAQKTKSLGQVTTLVTFDQPLYLKAREIIARCDVDLELSNVVIRLGGFHLLMSFMGAVGYIMDGSGLTDLFNTVYAVNSTEKIMTGHAYARAVRAHFLAHTVLAKLIFSYINFSPSFQFEMEELFYCGDLSEIIQKPERELYTNLNNEFEGQIRDLSQIGPTSKLWIQYFEMVTLMVRFIESERMGNWDLHLETVGNMLPYFHASGHNLYAKCAHLYLQDMRELELTMSPEEYEAFTSQGGFTIRRSEKLWCGTWTDMTIEQNLMKHMKSDGGLTRSRGVTESILSRWTQGMTSLQQVCDEIERFCDVSFATSEQHVDSRDTRIHRDNEDMKKMMDWFNQHPPFLENSELISLSKGIVGDEKVNCYRSKEIGNHIMSAIVGKDFKTVKLKRNDRVLPLSSMNHGILIDNLQIPINPIKLFQRISIAKQCGEELEEFLSFELCPYPLALFDDNGMRKGTKSSLYKVFKPLTDTTLLNNEVVYVVDGGFLLHRMVWSRGHTFALICKSYIEYILTRYSSNAVIVFDGYPNPEHKSTKNMERLRRSLKKRSVEIKFTESMIPTVPQENFLANEKNKSRLITMLMSTLNEVNIATKQAFEDADRLIVETAISLAPDYEKVAVVGEDVDLLVIMIGTNIPSNVFFLKPGKNKVPPSVYHTSTVIDSDIAEHMMFLHAMSGCDSTSALYKQGKLKCLKVLKKNPDILPHISLFRDSSSDQQKIIEAGEKFLVALYGGDYKQTTLNKLRFKEYLTSAYKISANLASLPPTLDAAKQHCLRVFHQVQLWLGNNLDAKQWGWKATKNSLIPITMLQAPAPDKLLRLISCKCKKNCLGNCGCRRAGLFCSNICKACEGKCSNIETLNFEDEDLDDQTDSSLLH